MLNWYVACRDCDLSGPHISTEIAAREAWDDQPRKSAVESADSMMTFQDGTSGRYYYKVTHEVIMALAAMIDELREKISGE